MLFDCIMYVHTFIARQSSSTNNNNNNAPKYLSAMVFRAYSLATSFQLCETVSRYAVAQCWRKMENIFAWIEEIWCAESRSPKKQKHSWVTEEKRTKNPIRIDYLQDFHVPKHMNAFALIAALAMAPNYQQSEQLSSCYLSKIYFWIEFEHSQNQELRKSKWKFENPHKNMHNFLWDCE